MSYDRDKSKEQLINELERLRLENAELKNSESKQKERFPSEEEVKRNSWINFLSSRVLLDSMQEIIAIKDLNGVHRGSSSAMCDLIGRPESYIVGRTDFDLFPHEQATFYVEMDKEVIETQELKKVEEQVTGLQGTAWVQTTKSPLFDHSGECIGIIVVVRDISERKKAEEELQRYRYLLDKSQEIAHLGSWELDVQSGRLAWSDETYRIFGLEPQEVEITYEMFLNFVHPEDRDAVGSTYMDSIHMNKDIEEIEHRIIRERDGGVRTVFEKCYHVRDDSGNIVRSIGMVQDITEQRQKEKEIKEREEKLQTIFDTVESGIFLVDKDLRIIQTNNAMTEMLQSEPEDIIGSRYIDYVHESEIENSYYKIRQLMHRELDSVHLERMYQRSDGTTFWGSLSGRRLYYPDGSFWGLVGVVTDITDRKQAEEALRESEERFKTVLENLPGGIFAHDLEGRILMVNTQASKNTGYSREELLRMTVWDIDPHAATRDDQANLWRRLEIGESITIESNHIMKDGTQYPTEIHLTSLILNEQPIILPIAFDISWRKQFEQELWESEQQFRTLFTESPVSITIHDKHSGEIIDANPKACASYGLSSVEELNAKGVWMEPPYSYTEALGWIKKAATEGPQQFEWLSRNIHGELFWEQVRLIPITINGVDRVLATAEDITELKHTVEALRKSEERYKKLINTSPDAIALVDEHGRFLTVNSAMAQRFGLTQKELEGKTYQEVMPKNLADKRIAYAKESIENDQLIYFEDEREGIYLQNYHVPIATSDNQKTFQIISRDITERKLAEKERDKEAENQQILLNNIQTQIWYMSDARTYGIANQAHAEFQGFTPQDMSFQDLYDILPEDVAEICHQGNAEVFATGQSDLTEEWSPHVSGEWRLLSILKTPKLRADGTVEYMVCSAEDITERKQAEEYLRYQKQLIETIINGIWDILAIQYPDHTIERYNQAGYKYLGLSPEEIVGKKCFELIGRNRECEPCATQQALQVKEPVNIEKYVPELDLYLDCRSSPILDEEGNIVRIVEHLRDISEQKRYEARLKAERDYIFQMFDSMSQFVFVVSQDYRLEFLNHSARGYFGDLMGEICYKQLQKDTLCSQCPVPQILNQGFSEPIGHRIEVFDRILEGNTTKLINQDGTVSALHVLEDVTEREEMKEALRQSENYYRSIFETTGTAMCIFDSDTIISLVNSNFEDISGYSKQEIEGKKSWVEFIHSEDLDCLKQNHYLALKDPAKAVNKYEFRCIVRNGEVRNVFMFADFIPGTNQTIASFIDITERKQMEEKLKEMSFYDSLTGLYNRNFFEEEMSRLEDGRYSPMGIVVCDLDGLKFVNDTLGHEAGDKMLINTAEILRQNFRSSDIIARIGGDEFAVLLPRTTREVIEQIQERIRQSMQDYNSKEREIPLSLSMGHASGEGGIADMHALFREADNRMYREKIQREGSARSAILQALTGSMQARDFNTQGHCDRLQELAICLARSLDLSQDFVNDLSLLTRFHDLGKVGIPDHILFKPGSLTEEEWEQMRQHCEVGHRIASSVPDLEPIADWILKHHERWDGRGYPLGLSGQEIPLACRILAIADAYDAMISDRPYRRAMTREEAIAELKRCAGTQFDPELVKRFVWIVQETDEA